MKSKDRKHSFDLGKCPICKAIGVSTLHFSSHGIFLGKIGHSAHSTKARQKYTCRICHSSGVPYVRLDPFSLVKHAVSSHGGLDKVIEATKDVPRDAPKMLLHTPVTPIKPSHNVAPGFTTVSNDKLNEFAGYRAELQASEAHNQVLEQKVAKLEAELQAAQQLLDEKHVDLSPEAMAMLGDK